MHLDSKCEFTALGGDLRTFIILKNRRGWTFENYRCKGEVDKGGNPLFYKSLITESISYPDHLEVYISNAWENVNTLNKEQVQNIFDELSEWISASENNLH
ncbi:hypothetical protein MUB16_02930 [Priestia sp. OVL9]|nr:hypothetical protein [Priestia sp. OVL9]